MYHIYHPHYYTVMSSDLLFLSPHCFFLPVTPLPIIPDSPSPGAESEKSPWPSRTCFVPRQTSPAVWRARREPFMLHSPNSWKTLSEYSAKKRNKVLTQSCLVSLEEVNPFVTSKELKQKVLRGINIFESESLRCHRNDETTQNWIEGNIVTNH